jgi:hypothetical protein
MNRRRHTAGLLLTLWALSLSGLVLFAWRVHLHRDLFDSSDYPTALGDTAYYTQPMSEGGNDFYEPALHFPAAPEGLFRQTVNPIVKADRLMLARGTEASGKHTVYVEKKRPDSGRYFLKTADDHYVAFGQRVLWPKYTPPAKAVLVEEP